MPNRSRASCATPADRGPGTPAMWKSDLVASLRGMDGAGVTWAYSVSRGGSIVPLLTEPWRLALSSFLVFETTATLGYA